MQRQSSITFLTASTMLKCDRPAFLHGGNECGSISPAFRFAWGRIRVAPFRTDGGAGDPTEMTVQGCSRDRCHYGRATLLSR